MLSKDKDFLIIKLVNLNKDYVRKDLNSVVENIYIFRVEIKDIEKIYPKIVILVLSIKIIVLLWKIRDLEEHYIDVVLLVKEDFSFIVDRKIRV